MSRENKTAEKQLSDPEYFYKFMGHAPDNCKIIGNLNIIINMKKLDLGDLFTRDEFRERVENGLFIDSDGEGQYSNEIGQVNGYLLLLLHQMKLKTKIWNIHM